MLYLLTDTHDNKMFVKVGLAKNIVDRLSHYKTYNPHAFVIATCRGTREDENRCHAELKKRGFTRVGQTEWFEVDKIFFTQVAEMGFSLFLPPSKAVHQHPINESILMFKK